LLLGLLLPTSLVAQEAPDAPVDPALYQDLEWRNIGPFRGGRATTVSGVVQDPQTYYMGATGGGVWKTIDAGVSWQNVSDGFFGGSIGAVAVAPSDPNVVYVGTGESPIRGVMSSHGDGVYKSTDGGQTWTAIGLERTRQISEIQIHPTNPDVVYVAAQGNAWTDNPERGIYRSMDGGATWEHVLHVDDGTGASDLSLDVTNPRILYAAFWDHQRLPWKVISGGAGSGLFKSTDGGTTWTRLTDGLPDLMGKIGVAVSPADPSRVWAIIEAEEGGLYRSDNAGTSWRRVNSERVLQARSWYYMHITADPQDAQTVYVMNAPLLRSTDGGGSFTPIAVPHGDNHDLWIHPDDNAVMINANDGGANISFNGGGSWSTQSNQPTAQFYRVIADNQFPYRLYAGQQDNSTVSIASRTMGSGIGRADWHAVGGCESAFPAFDPENPRYVYAGCYQGIISEYDRVTQQSRSVMAYQYLGLGEQPKDLKYRFNWNAPIVVSPHDPATIYHAGNMVFKSTDRGMSWTPISDELTHYDEAKLGPGGGPITNEAAGGETYHTISYLVASPHADGTLWVGTDDGRVHLTRDEGATWTEITPDGLPEALINTIEVSPHDPATAYLAVTRYKFGDYTPHHFKTTDYGQTWTRLVDGFADEAWVRVVREDPARPGLLYAGTERGLYLSADGGQRWQPFQQNLPMVPITDLVVHQGDLVVATQGRAFWILDDLTPLHQLTDAVAEGGTHLMAPRPAIRTGGSNPPRTTEGRNPPSGAILDYLLPARPDTAHVALTLDILDGDTVLRTLTSPDDLSTDVGHHRVVWNFRTETLTEVPGLFVFGSLSGHRAAPGTYTVRLIADGDTLTQPLEVRPDPRLEATPAQWTEQVALLEEIGTTVDDLHEAVLRMRRVRDQVDQLTALTEHHAEADTIQAAGQAVTDAITALEQELVQPKQQTFQDVINFPNQLNAHFLNLMSSLDGAGPHVTQGMRDRHADLKAAWGTHQAEMTRLLDEDLAAFNTLFESLDLPAVIVPAEPPAPAVPPVSASDD
ncbi:MAG: glycosyl hydrolase, partial [Bacteroidota bacterium]